LSPILALLALSVALPVATAAATPGANPLQQGNAVAEVPARIAEALELVRVGDLNGAIAIAEALCDEEDPPEPAFALLGSLHVEAGNMEEALAILTPHATRESADPGVLYNAGRAAEALGNLDDAGNYYRRSLAIERRSPALRALGMLLGRAGRPADAYTFLQPWAAANPQDQEARLAAAAGAIALERVPDAEALLQGLNTDDPGVKLLRAQVLLQKADPWGAISELRLLADEPPAGIEGALRRTLARAYLVVGDAEAALGEMETVDTSGPEDAVLLASAYFQAGQPDAATTTLAPLAEPLLGAPPPANPPPVARDIVLEYGRFLHAAGDAERAVPFLRLATELGPTRADGYQALGQALAASGDREEARRVLDRFQSLSRESDDDVASVNRMRRDIADPTGREVRKALDVAAGGDLETALDSLGREAQLAPADPRPAYAASAILLDAGRPEEALAAADRALAAAPNRADGLYQRGAVLMALDRLAEAEDMFRQALDAQPQHTAALSDYAVLLMSSRRPGEARVFLERLLEIRPGDRLARSHLERLGHDPQVEASDGRSWVRTGREQMGAGNFQAAEESFRQALSLDLSDAALRLDLASPLWENGKPAEAVLHAREAVELEETSAAAHRLLGGLLLWRGAHLEAAESLRRATNLTEPDAALLIELGQAWSGAASEEETAERLGPLNRAEAAFRQALDLAPEHSEAAYGLAQVLQRLGRTEEAAAALERYEKLYGSDQDRAREGGLDRRTSPPGG